MFLIVPTTRKFKILYTVVVEAATALAASDLLDFRRQPALVPSEPPVPACEEAETRQIEVWGKPGVTWSKERPDHGLQQLLLN